MNSKTIYIIKSKFNLNYIFTKLIFPLIFPFIIHNNVSAQGAAMGNPKCLPGFTDELISSGWSDLRQITFDSLGRMFVVEGEGKVFIIDTNGVKQITPLIDISEEVGWWNAHGLLGMALDKDFLSNGYFYLMYTVDRHYLMYYGTAQYNPNIDDYHDATITRVTRFKADSSTNYTTILPGSRFILIGADKKTGIAVTYNNHDGGGIEMSPDGSLIISTGDSGHGGATDTGSNAQTYYVQALADSILTPETNVGAYRAQQKQSPNGKILRIDPMTGLGLPSNPFYDPAHPESFDSKVWSLGLRNPFRFSIRPGTSAINDMTAGQPGSLFISDVGFHTWEGLYVADAGAKNFGWPIYEGMFPHYFFSVQNIENKYAPNTLYGINGCANQYYKFTELLINATLNPTPSWPNSCDSSVQIPASYCSMRTRPLLSYNHTTPIAYVPGYIGNDPTEFHVGAAGSPATGPELYGNCIAGCAWNSGSSYPAQFSNQLFFSEFGKGYIAFANVDANNNLTSLDTFATSLGDAIAIVYSHKHQCMYYIEYPYEIHRIRYTYGLNVAPKAVATQDVLYGPGPLTVNFNAQQSSDPENAPLTYFWDFGDGNTSTLIAPQHTFNPPTSNPTEYFVNLTVTDTGGLTGTKQLLVSVNNTPPVVQITSPVDGTYYSAVVSQVHNMTANVSDAEHGPAQLHYKWYTALHHNLHEHPNPIDTNISSYFVSDPEDCENTYYYEVTLTVTDDAGLSTQQTVEIYQECPITANFTSDVTSVCRGDSVHYYSLVIGHADSVYWIFQNGSPSTSKKFDPVVAYKYGYGPRDVTMVAYNFLGTDTLFMNDYMFIKNNAEVNQNITGTIVTCIDDSILLSTNDSNIYKFQWKKNGVSLPNDTLNSYLVKTTGIYNVTVTLSLNGCSRTSTPLNYVEHNISNSLTLSGSSLLCNTDSVILFADTDPSYSYQWYKDGNLIIGQYSNSYTAKSTGSYYASINDTNTCAATTNPVSIVKTPESAIVFTSDSIICPAGDVVLMDANTGTGLIYQWYMNGSIITGAASSSYSATVAGIYTALVSDAGGCSHMSNTLEVTSCTGLIDNHSNELISIYPNPALEQINLSIKKDVKPPVIIKVFDSIGKLVLSVRYDTISTNMPIEINTAGLMQGIYQLHIEYDTKSLVKKIVKN